jgi:hypothetical protein
MRAGSGVQRGGARRAKRSVGRVCARRCNPVTKSLVLLHDAVNDADDDAWGEKRGGGSPLSGTAQCVQRENKREGEISITVYVQTQLARTCESAHARARMCSELPQRIRRHEGGYNNKTMPLSVWREGKAS